jgi:hypothetical protein
MSDTRGGESKVMSRRDNPDRRRPRFPAFLLVLPLLLAAMAVACNGDDNDEPTPTPTPAEDATPTPGDQTPTPLATPTPEPTPDPAPQVEVTPVDEPFEIRAREAINVRDIPSTDGMLLSTLFPGETARVIGEASGEEVEEGDDTWYQVELTRDGIGIRGFLYAAYVDRV